MAVLLYVMISCISRLLHASVLLLGPTHAITTHGILDGASHCCIYTCTVRYGLGMVYYKQEKYDLAEYHFRKAQSINPSSPVLQCYTAMALHSQRKSVLALNILDKVQYEVIHLFHKVTSIRRLNCIPRFLS